MHIRIKCGQNRKEVRKADCNGREVGNMFWDRAALVLVIIGALNWGAVGLFGFDLVAFICGGQMAVLSRIIYAVVGIAGLWCVSLLFRENATGKAAI